MEYEYWFHIDHTPLGIGYHKRYTPGYYFKFFNQVSIIDVYFLEERYGKGDDSPFIDLLKLTDFEKFLETRKPT